MTKAKSSISPTSTKPTKTKTSAASGTKIKKAKKIHDVRLEQPKQVVGRPVAPNIARWRRWLATGSRSLRNFNKWPVVFAVFGALVLIATTLAWSYLGARLQQANADQVADSLLFANSATFHAAAFPAQHSFLLKWPLFYVTRLAGFSQLSFIVTTMAVTTITVGCFAILLYRINRRPLVFGTICLALASCLLLVPAQPYAGGLLPVNMAMITTRNFEYIVYMLGLALIAKNPKFTNWRVWLAVLVLAVVCASDRLFLDLSLAGAGAAMVGYALRRHWKFVILSVNWLLIGLIVGALALSALWVIDARHVTHIVGQSSASPYAAVNNAKGLALAGTYGISDLLTNFGANPAYDGTVLRQIPRLATHRLLSVSGVSFVINALILLYGLLVCARILYASLFTTLGGGVKNNAPIRLATMLIWSSLAAAGVFVISNHDYAVDSRYLTITLFAVFIAIAAYMCDKHAPSRRLLVIAAVLCVSMGAATPQVIHNYHADRLALADINSRNQLVAQALATRHTTTLLGDYWRVLPIAAESSKPGQIQPFSLQNCTQPRTVLTSQVWQPNLHTHPFAYLLSFDKGLTDYPQCNLQQIVKYYGRPNVTELIAGTLAKPKEMLLFYDQGLQEPMHLSGGTLSTVLPIPLDELPRTSCDVPTAMNVVAHEDDDLLFINPDTLHELQVGHCVRTVYLTAGDDGLDRGYWLNREQGAEAAYSAMTGSKQPWVERTVQLTDHQYIAVANLLGDSQVSLIFFRLPDGGLRGQGFGATHQESLASLYKGQMGALHSVDGQSFYNSDQLTASLTKLFKTFNPTIIRTQSSYHGMRFSDHADHQAVGLFVRRAYDAYEKEQFANEVTVPLNYYIGYPIRERPANVSGDDYRSKQATFLKYSLFDGAVCHSTEQCDHTETYGAYLAREYQNPK